MPDTPAYISSHTSSRQIRWLQGGLFFAAAAALMLTVWSMQRSVQQASITMATSQGEHLLRALRHQQVLPLNAQFLDGMARDLTAVGLKRVVVYQPQGEVVYQFDDEQPGATPPALSAVTASPAARGAWPIEGGRMRMLAPPVPRGPLKPPGAPPAGPPPDGPLSPMDAPPPPGGMRPTPTGPAKLIMVEFAPTVSQRLEEGGTQTLAVGALVALMLLGSAGVVWRLSLRAEAAQRARERDRQLATLGEMSAVLAHEIRNPLASLKGHAQLLSEGLDDAPRKKRKADFVIKEAIRLEKLCEDLLSMVRAGKVQRAEADPRQVVQASADAVDAERFALHLDASPKVWPLDAARMQQVLINLMRNATQAAPDGPPTEVTVASRGAALTITVRDHGPGVPPEAAEHIFEPFHTNRVKGGTGLGLAVARRIVEQHDGTLTTHNHPEGGAVFTISLPRA